MLRPLPQQRVGKSWWLTVISDGQVLLSGSVYLMAEVGSVMCWEARGALSSVAVRTEAGFDLVGAGTEASRIVDRLGSPRMDELLDDAREQWDLILFDAPPALAAGDALTIASKTDGAVLVVHAGQDERGLLVRLANAVGSRAPKCLALSSTKLARSLVDTSRRTSASCVIIQRWLEQRVSGSCHRRCRIHRIPSR